jgi:hypothetical protein
MHHQYTEKNPGPQRGSFECDRWFVGGGLGVSQVSLIEADWDAGTKGYILEIDQIILSNGSEWQVGLK